MHTSQAQKDKPSAGHIVVPYVWALGESFKNICCKYGVQTYFKGVLQSNNFLSDQRTKTPRKGKVMSFTVAEVDYNEEYIGETSRTLEERYKEHLNKPSPIHVQSLQTGHSATSDNFNIIGREDQGLTRLLKEYIHQGQQSHPQ